MKLTTKLVITKYRIMEQYEKPIISETEFVSQKVAKSFMANVFLWMFVAMGITALTAYLAASSSAFFQMLFTETGKMSIMGWVITFAPFALVLIMSSRFDKMSVSSMMILFVIYSLLMGLSLSFIFWAYTSASIFKTFLITGGMFGIMAVAGYVTKTDLTKFGNILLMGLIGIIIASLVNFFTKSATLDYVISFIGVLIFTGLTAWDVQKLKTIGASNMIQGDTMAKVAIWGALSLYLDFINLFLFLLRIFGNDRN
jgi:Integral membrane protein, interacts with FtsH